MLNCGLYQSRIQKKKYGCKQETWTGELEVHIIEGVLHQGKSKGQRSHNRVLEEARQSEAFMCKKRDYCLPADGKCYGSHWERLWPSGEGHTCRQGPEIDILPALSHSQPLLAGLPIGWTQQKPLGTTPGGAIHTGPGQLRVETGGVHVKQQMEDS